MDNTEWLNVPFIYWHLAPDEIGADLRHTNAQMAIHSAHGTGVYFGDCGSLAPDAHFSFISKIHSNGLAAQVSLA